MEGNAPDRVMRSGVFFYRARLEIRHRKPLPATFLELF
jgi:hypothetical protein